MNANFCRAGLILGALVLFCAPAQAEPADPKKWSKIENNSGKAYILTDVDMTAKTTVGTLWCKKKGTPGNGKKINVKGDSYTIDPGSHEFYFDTTLTKFAMHMKLQDAASNHSVLVHVTNLDPTTPGTEIQISSEPLNSCNVVVDPTGYRNLAGGVLFTIRPLTAAPGGTDE